MFESRKKDKTAFGVEVADRAYRLRFARYVELADEVAMLVKERWHDPDGIVRLLDVGCRKGRLIDYHTDRGVAKRMRHFGFDVDHRRLLQMRRKDEWLRVCGRCEDGLPYRDRSFDVVVCEQVLEHLDEPDLVIREAARVLRPGGRLYVGVPSFPPGVRWIRAVVVPWLDRYRGIVRDHVQVFSARSARDLVARCPDFEVLDVRGFRFVTGGWIKFLEDFRWWWRLNRWLGRRLPALAIDVQVVARRR